ncbi:MAG TPA: hypothetical protein VF215_04770, partial [Thermoanaerobaculia bacterium]
MYRRLVMPLMALTALLSLLAVIVPTGATGAERLGSDTYVFGRNTTIDAPINGSLQVYNANVTIASAVAGDLLVAGGSVTFTGNGRVDGNLIYAASRITNAGDRVKG